MGWDVIDLMTFLENLSGGSKNQQASSSSATSYSEGLVSRRIPRQTFVSTRLYLATIQFLLWSATAVRGQSTNQGESKSTSSTPLMMNLVCDGQNYQFACI